MWHLHDVVRPGVLSRNLSNWEPFGTNCAPPTPMREIGLNNRCCGNRLGWTAVNMYTVYFYYIPSKKIHGAPDAVASAEQSMKGSRCSSLVSFLRTFLSSLFSPYRSVFLGTLLSFFLDRSYSFLWIHQESTWHLGPQCRWPSANVKPCPNPLSMAFDFAIAVTALCL